MKKVDKNLLKKLADDLLFDMEEKEFDALLKDFDIILNQLEFINQIDGIQDASPLTFPFTLKSGGLREDIQGKCLSVQEVLANAKDTKLNQIKIMKVVK